MGVECVSGKPTEGPRLSEHPLYAIHRQMIQRCENPNVKGYESYGGRGISVCGPWHTFSRWLVDVGPRPEGKDEKGIALWSIDRIDTNGNYEPGNVKWSTRSEQSLNKNKYAHKVRRPIQLTCKAGLHKMTEKNTKTHEGRRRCVECRRIREGADMTTTTRKSSYEGDRFGDWTVTARVEGREEWMVKGKRYWVAVNGKTSEVRTVEQTALKDLPKEDVVAGVPVVANGANLVVPSWADGLPTVEMDASSCLSPLCCNPSEDDEIFFGEAPEIPFVPGIHQAVTDEEKELERNLDGKIPGNNKGDLVLEPDWAEKAVAVMGGPIKPITGVKDVLHNLGVTTITKAEAAEIDALDWTAELPLENTVTRFGGLGEAAEETVSEAELDGRVPAPDPIRTAIRALMGEIHAAREQATMMEDQVVQLRLQLDGLMELADQALKAALTR